MSARTGLWEPWVSNHPGPPGCGINRTYSRTLQPHRSCTGLGRPPHQTPIGLRAEVVFTSATCVRDSGRILLSHERHPLHTANSVPWRHQSDYTAYWLSSDSNCGRWIPPLRLATIPCCGRTRWPWVIAHPRLPQIRTCEYYRIRFLKSWVRCMTKLGTHRASRSKRVKSEQNTEFLPVHRADVVAAIEPLTPSILDFLAEPVHRF